MNAGDTYKKNRRRPSRGVIAAARWLVFFLLANLCPNSIWANPVGATVARGSASLTQSGSRLNIQVSQGTVLNWRSFNIKPGETTTFQQPSANSVVWNRIFDPNLSQVWGNLNANGWVVLMNQNGFYFGPNSVINVHGLMVTTSPSAPESSPGGGFWQFSGTPPLASIINYGEIKAQAGGSVFLVAERVENHGKISAPGGSIGLFAGKEVLVSERPDGRGLSASVKLPAGSVDNTGKLIADAGTIALHARVVNQNGLVQANSVRERNGVIELFASDNLHLGPESVLQANGDNTSVSKGGNITLKSDTTFTDAAGSRIEVRGSAQGGNGGNVELSAPKMSAIHSGLDGSAKAGWKGGGLVLDPSDIFLSSDTGDSTTPAMVSSGDPPDQLHLNVNSAFQGFSQIRLEATHNISLDPFTIWNLNDSTGINTPGSTLTLEAGKDIAFGAGSRIVGGSGWSLRLAAGVDFSAAVDPSTKYHPVRSGIGSIRFGGDDNSGSGALETSDGNISLEAGQDIVLGSGFIRTVQGGKIDITTKAGDVNPGTDLDDPDNAKGYLQFTRFGSPLRPAGIGGIGTEYGGDVTITSGHDIASDGDRPSIGAYGSGNVTLKAVNAITGKFIVVNGHGTLQAGVDVGRLIGYDPRPVKLSLVSGGWDVIAGRDIYFNEVLNPNGAFNGNGRSFKDADGNPVRDANGRLVLVRYLFDYDDHAYLHLRAGNSVQITGAPAHFTDNADEGTSLPPQLDIQAGKGGIVLAKDITLYPSAFGSLHITTTDGGSLRSSQTENTHVGEGDDLEITPSTFFQLVMSDSSNRKYSDFVSGHATTPLHLNDSDPVTLAIDGDVRNIFLKSPKQTRISVGGDAVNFSFEAQNLRPGDLSRISVAGDYSATSDNTSVTLSDAPTKKQFDDIFTDPIYVSDVDKALASRLKYDEATHRLQITGPLSGEDLRHLKHPKIKAVNPDLSPVFDANGDPDLVDATFTQDIQALQALQTASLNLLDPSVKSGAERGLKIGGPGSLAISARSMDLGSSDGIRSVGNLLNFYLDLIPLQPGEARGNITLDLAGDLKMTASSISSFNGGNISLNATHGGSMNIGAGGESSADDTPKGIYTAHGGDLSVLADGNIDVSGSRIGTFDGGNVTVVSRNGDVNAGSGARGHITVATRLALDAAGVPQPVNERYSGSGILAFTARNSHVRVGDITVAAGNDILANSGGVLQLVFNHTDLTQPLLSLNAGRDISANQAGVLGVRENLIAGRDIKGLFVAGGDIQLSAQQNFSGSILGGGSVAVSAGQNVSGSIVGGGAVGVSGSQVSATIVSTAGAVTASGNVIGTIGAFSAAAAPVATQTTTEQEKKTVAAKTDEEDDETKRKRAAKAPVLARTTGRVTVILPNQK